MASLNRISIIGNIGKDAELKDVGKNKVANFSVGVSEKWKDNSGAAHEATTWFRVEAWGTQAEVAASYIRKGALVYVEGKMHCRSVEKDGQKKEYWQLKCEKFVLLGGKVVAQPRADANVNTQGRDVPQKPAEGATPFEDDDIPF